MKRHSGNFDTTILSESELIYKSRRGITRNRVLDICEETRLTLEEMSEFIHISPRTIQRREYRQHLSSEISEKVLLIRNLYSRGARTFGSAEVFINWMNTPNYSFDGKIPKSYLDTFSGIEFIKQELGRLEYGII